MTESTCIRNRVAAAIAAGCAGLALAGAASAVDLRDWGRKVPVGERFIVLAQFSNQAVLDKETQLVWQRSPSTLVTNNWGARLRCIGAKIGNRLGWRLPSVHELASLFDPSAPGLALPAGHPFLFVQKTDYWTATESAELSNRSWRVDFDNAAVHPINYNFDSSTEAHYWCVRGAGSVDAY